MRVPRVATVALLSLLACSVASCKRGDSAQPTDAGTARPGPPAGYGPGLGLHLKSLQGDEVVAAVYAEGGRDLAASSKELAPAIFGAITTCKDLTDALKLGQVSSFRLAVEGTKLKRRADTGASCAAAALEGTTVAAGNAGNYLVFIEVGPPAP